MSKFYNGEYNAIGKINRAKGFFADLLFAFLEKKNNINAIENLANHLNVTVDDVNEWLKRESLPNRELLTRVIGVIRGDDYFETKKYSNGDNVETSSWADIAEIVHEAQNVQAFQNLKLTHTKSN